MTLASGMPSCRASDRGRPTGTAPQVPTTRPAACAATRRSFCSTPTPEHCTGPSRSGPRCSGGTYAGLGHEAAIGHLLDLGVTTVELLPVHESVPEAFLRQRGLTNYWGYNTVGYFAPHQGYSAAVRAGRPGGQVTEFKAMVDALHRAGLEVLLDGWTLATRAITSTRLAAAIRSTSATP